MCVEGGETCPESQTQRDVVAGWRRAFSNQRVSLSLFCVLCCCNNPRTVRYTDVRLSSSFQNDSVEWESFTFEKFYQIYKNLCPRIDIDELFTKL